VLWDCPDDGFGCLDDTVVSFGSSWFLSEQACFCDLLRGIMSGRHLCSFWTVNPIRLNRILPAPQPIFSPLFGSFCRLMHFPCDFYAYFSRARVIFAVSLHPRYVFNTLLLISLSFYA
jgi:hypothetical protein